MTTSEMSTGLFSSTKADFRELAVWGEARCLTLAVHEWATTIQHSQEGRVLVPEIESVCVAILARLIEAYDGSEVKNAAKLLGETDELLKRLDRLLDPFLTSGFVLNTQVSLLRQEALRVRKLLMQQITG